MPNVLTILAGITWERITRKPASFTPSLHRTTHEYGGNDEIPVAENGTETINYELSFSSSEYIATLLTNNLTADREYEFPDIDGIVCLQEYLQMTVCENEFETIIYS